MPRTVTTRCPACGQNFEQPYDPGRRRTYDSDACRQAAYRQRKATEREQARYDSWRQDAKSERASERARSGHTDPQREKIRRQIGALLRKAASSTFAPEALACRAKAAELAAKYGFKIRSNTHPAG